jgi:hypothetical protein
MPKRLLAFCCLVLAAAAVQAASTEETLTLPSGIQIVSERYPARHGHLVLWLTGEFGRAKEVDRAAEYLAAHHLETWVTDWLSPYFLPPLPSSVDQVPAADLGDWLEAVRRKSGGRRIVFVAAGHSAVWVLRAVHAWRQRHGNGAADPTAGAVLLYPILYRNLEPGKPPQYDRLVSDTPIHAVVVQPASSAGYWWREQLKAAMEAAGSRVSIEILPGVRDVYYRRADASPRERWEAERLGKTLRAAMRPLLEREQR